MSASSELDAKASRRCALQLRMLDSRDAIDRLGKVLPNRSLAHERAAAARCEPIVTAPPLSGLFDPPAFDQPLALEAIKRRIERGDVKLDERLGSHFDLLADVVAVALPFFKQRQNQQFGAATLHLALEHR